MDTSIINHWEFFLACFALVLVTNAIMSRQSQSFFTMGTTRKSFSIFDLEFPASPASAANLILGIGKLTEAPKIRRALRWQLYVDFLFMPGVYLSIFFLCHKAGLKTGGWPGDIFCALAYLQLAAWLCDIIENIILLRLMKHPEPFSDNGFKAYQRMELLKWGSSLTGFLYLLRPSCIFGSMALTTAIPLSIWCYSQPN